MTFIVFVELLRFLWATQSRMARFPHNPTSFPPERLGDVEARHSVRYRCKTWLKGDASRHACECSCCGDVI